MEEACLLLILNLDFAFAFFLVLYLALEGKLFFEGGGDVTA